MSPVNTFYFPNIYWHIFKNNVWLMIEKVTYPKTNELNFEVVNQIYYDSFLNIRNSDTWNYWLIHIIEAYSWTYQYICKSVQIPLSLLNFNFNISLSFINSSIYFSFFECAWACTFQLSYTRTGCWLLKIRCFHVHTYLTVDFHHFISMRPCKLIFSLFYKQTQIYKNCVRSIK